MKYIRTTDNIYKSILLSITKITKIEENGEEYPCLEIFLGFSADGFRMTRNERIIKESDNIEELCDEFVTAYLDGFHQISPFPSKVDNMLGHSVYGAIWTYKGLIYVAKMNKNGELELLCKD